MNEMKISHYCVMNEGRICVDARDVILYLHKAKNSNLSIEQIINTYEELVEMARTKLETSNQTPKIQ